MYLKICMSPVSCKYVLEAAWGRIKAPYKSWFRNREGKITLKIKCECFISGSCSEPWTGSRIRRGKTGNNPYFGTLTCLSESHLVHGVKFGSLGNIPVNILVCTINRITHTVPVIQVLLIPWIVPVGYILFDGNYQMIEHQTSRIKLLKTVATAAKIKKPT